MVDLVISNPGFYGNTSAFNIKKKSQISSCDWRTSYSKTIVLGVLAQLLRSLVSASVDVVLFALGDDTFLDDDVIVGVNHVDFSNG